MTDWEPSTERRSMTEGEVTVENYERYGQDDGVLWQAKFRKFSAYGIRNTRLVARKSAEQAYELLVQLAELEVENLVYPAPRGADEVDMTCNERCVLCDEHRAGPCFHSRTEVIAFVRGVRSPRSGVDNGIPF